MDIIDGSANWGRVVVLHSGVWGSVCSIGWTDAAANVTCRNMSYEGGFASDSPGKGDIPRWITRLRCTGTETNLDECVTGQWGETTYMCNDAYVLCYKKGIYV